MISSPPVVFLDGMSSQLGSIQCPCGNVILIQCSDFVNFLIVQNRHLVRSDDLSLIFVSADTHFDKLMHLIHLYETNRFRQLSSSSGRSIPPQTGR